MRILTAIFLLLVASGCGGSQAAAESPEPAAPPAAEHAPPPEPAPEPAPAAAATQEQQAPPAEPKATVATDATHSVFALLKIKDPKAFTASLEGLHADLEKASVIAYVVSQGQDQADTVIAHLMGKSGDKLKAFAEAEKAKKDGLFAKASELFVAQDDGYQTPSPWPTEKTYSVFLRFKPKDYKAWRESFDKNGEVRTASGVIGYGIHHSLVDERVIVHYVAKSTDLLRQIATMPEVKKAMKEQGMGSPKPFYATIISAQNVSATKK